MLNEQNPQEPLDHAKIHKEIQADRHAVLLEDEPLTADQLNGKYNPHGDGENPYFDRARWRDAVADEHTIIGYWDWIEHQIGQYHGYALPDAA